MKQTMFVCGIVAAFGLGLAAAQRLERINPPGLSTPQTYSHVIKAGKLVFIAGQVGSGPDGRIAGPTMKEQMEQTLENLRTALQSQGLDFSHVAKITVFTTSVAEFRATDVAEIRARYFADNRPASTLVQISQLASPEYKIEIEAIAVAP